VPWLACCVCGGTCAVAGDVRTPSAERHATKYEVFLTNPERRWTPMKAVMFQPPVVELWPKKLDEPGELDENLWEANSILLL